MQPTDPCLEEKWILASRFAATEPQKNVDVVPTFAAWCRVLKTLSPWVRPSQLEWASIRRKKSDARVGSMITETWRNFYSAMSGGKRELKY